MIKSEYTRLLAELEMEYHETWTKHLTQYTKQLFTMQKEYNIAVDKINQEFIFGKSE